MKVVFDSNYLIEGIEILLEEDRILNCYHPLVPYKHHLVQELQSLGCKTRDDCLALSDDALYSAGLPAGMAGLFRRFLRLYDYKGRGPKDVPGVENRSAEEITSMLELMRLPGVKAIRAQLYYHCGLKSLTDFAVSDATALQKHIASIIEQEELPYTPPLPKELRTQIAVAKVFIECAVK